MQAESLIAVLLRSRCTEDELVAFMPLLLRSAGARLEPATSAALFTRIGALIDATPYDDDAKLQQKLRDYYAAHPPPPALKRAVEDLFKQSVGAATADAFEALAKQARAEPHEPLTSKPVFDLNDQERN